MGDTTTESFSDLLTQIYSAVREDGSTNLIVGQTKSVVQRAIIVELSAVVLARRNQENEYVPASREHDVYYEFTNLVMSSNKLVSVEDVASDARLGKLHSRLLEVSGVSLSNIVGVPVRDSNGQCIGAIHAINKRNTNTNTTSSSAVPNSSSSSSSSSSSGSSSSGSGSSSSGAGGASDRAEFSAGNFADLNSIATATSIALQLAQKFAKAELRRKTDAALISIIRERSGDEPLLHTWTTTIQAIIQLFDPQLCSIFLCDHTNNEVFNVATRAGEDIVGLTLPFGKGIVGTVAETGIPLRTENAYADRRFFSLVDKYTGQTTKTVLCMPVPGFQRNSRPIAVVQVINKIDGSPFYAEEEQAMETLCGELSQVLRRRAMEINELKHRAHRHLTTHHADSEVLEESILHEYGAVTKQYVTETEGVKRRVSFLGYSKTLVPDLSELTEEDIMRLISNHNTDPFEMQEATLVELAAQMISSYGLLEKFNVTPEAIRNFIGHVRMKYRPANAFHNFRHAWGVMHLSFMLLRYGADELLTTLDIFALLISAVCHDVDHPGHNNAFEVAMRSEWALFYADDAVLERHHLAMTHVILADPNVTVIGGLTPEQQVEFRQSLTSAILATDMSQHFKLVDEILRRTATPNPYNRSDPASRKALIGHILHAADIGAQTQCRSLALKWTDRLVAEFSYQAQKEIDARIPLTPFLHGLDDELKKMQLQVGFLNGIVIPLWTALSAVLPELEKTALAQLESNRVYYQEQVERLTAERAPPPAALSPSPATAAASADVPTDSDAPES